MRVKSILTAAILSCFGMTANAENVMDTDVVVVGIPGKVGDGINMALAAGAAKDGREFINMSYRPGPSKESTTNHYAASTKQPHLWLNTKGEAAGKAFRANSINELAHKTGMDY